MAQRRTLSMKIIDSDGFLELPLEAQALYFHLVLRADDDGFIGNAQRVARTTGSNASDLSHLIQTRFVLSFPNGIVVIRHWGVHLSVKKDRYHPTAFVRELSCLEKQADGTYEFVNTPHMEPSESPSVPECPPDRSQSGDKKEPETQAVGDILEPVCLPNTLRADSDPDTILSNTIVNHINPSADAAACVDALVPLSLPNEQQLLAAALDAGFSRNPATMERLLGLIREYGQGPFADAIAEAVDARATSPAYLRTILQTWRANGGKKASQALFANQRGYSCHNARNHPVSVHPPREPTASISNNPFAEYEEVSL